MKGPELKIEFCAYYNDKKEKFDEGGLYPFLEYCQSSKPKDVVVRVDYEMGFDEIDIYCESLAISNLSYEKIDDGNFVAKFTCDSKSGKPLMRVIYALGKAGNGGHSYTFTVGKEKFYFDGDGADRIMKINGVKFPKIKSSYDLGKVWNDTTRKNNEEIDNNMSVNIEEIVRQSIKNIANESHGKKKHNVPKDALAAMRKGNREADQEIFGDGFHQTKKVHKAKNDYSRKNNKVNVNTIDKFKENESVNRISMNDVHYMVTECVKRILKEGMNADYSEKEDYGDYYPDLKVNWGNNIESLISKLEEKFAEVIAPEEDEYGISSTPFKNLINHLKYYYEHTTFDSACFNAIYKMLDDYDFTSDGEVISILKQLKKYC